MTPTSLKKMMTTRKYHMLVHDRKTKMMTDSLTSCLSCLRNYNSTITVKQPVITGFREEVSVSFTAGRGVSLLKRREDDKRKENLKTTFSKRMYIL